MKSTKVIKLGCLIDKTNLQLFLQQAWAARDFRKSLNFCEDIIGYYFEDIQEKACPGIIEQGHITSYLSQDLCWVSKNHIPDNKKSISPSKFDYNLEKAKLDVMRKKRNNSQIYKDGLIKIKKIRLDTHKILYAEAKCHWGSCNDESEAFKKSLSDVLKNRQKGISSYIKRSNSPLSIRCQIQKSTGQSWDIITKDDNKGQFKFINTGKNKRYAAKLCIGKDTNNQKQWINVSAKFRGWNVPDDAEVKYVKLVAKQSGYSYKFHLCITVEASWDEKQNTNKGTVALDWGHRESFNELLAFTWAGSDNATGIINIDKVRKLIDRADEIREERSLAFNNIKQSIPNIGKSNSTSKAIKLIKNLGVATKKQSLWIDLEKSLRKKEDCVRRKALNVRKEIYLKEIQKLKNKYSKFVFEDLKGESFKQMDKNGHSARRKRTNRDLVARYEFESFIGKNNIIKVDKWRTSKNCNKCMHTNEIGSSKIFVCNNCNNIDDRDLNAAKNILLLGLENQGLNNSAHVFNKPKKGKLTSLRDLK